MTRTAKLAETKQKLKEALEGYIKAKTRKYIANEQTNSLKELKQEIINLKDFINENFKEELIK